MNEEQLKAFMGDLMMKALSNKPEILAEIQAHLMNASKSYEGLEKFEARCLEAESGEKPMTLEAATQMIRVLTKTCRRQDRAIQHLSCLALIYGLGSSYDGDAAAAATRFGKGGEALRAMWKAKTGQ